MPKVNVKDKRRQQLIEANIASIAKRGFTETTITHISEGAGMSRGIVNFYFTTKESMMLATCRYIAEEYTNAWKDALVKAKGKSPIEKLHAIVHANFHKSICSEKRLALWAAFCGHAATHQEYRKILAKYDAEHHNAIAALWLEGHAGEVKAKSRSEEFASHVHAMVRGLWMAYLLSPANNNRETLAGICTSFIDEREVTPHVENKQVILKDVKSGASKEKKKQKKKQVQQLDFGDLFSAKG